MRLQLNCFWVWRNVRPGGFVTMLLNEDEKLRAAALDATAAGGGAGGSGSGSGDGNGQGDSGDMSAAGADSGACASAVGRGAAHRRELRRQLANRAFKRTHLEAQGRISTRRRVTCLSNRGLGRALFGTSGF